MITIDSLEKTFMNGTLETRVLRGVSTTIESKDFVAIMGRSGAGKSTLLYQLGLLDTPTGGKIWFDNINVTNISEEEKSKLRLESFGFVFQDYALLPELTAIEQVMMPLLMRGYSRIDAKNKAYQTLSDVGLADRAFFVPSKLSGGQQQRVSIARAITHDPKVLFADEPTANLDTQNGNQVMEVFAELHSKGTTIVLVTHEPEYAQYAKRSLNMSDGVIIEDTRKS